MSTPGLRFTTTSAAERANGALALCSPLARLLWFELRLLMAENGDEPGFLLIDGKRPTPAQIATLTGTDPAHVKELLAELEGHKVFTRDKRGVVYCAALVKRAKLRENGRRGGNPNLLTGNGNSGLVNQNKSLVNQGDNQKRNQKLNQSLPVDTAKPMPAKANGALVNQGPNQAPKSLIGDSESGNPSFHTESLPNKPARKRAGVGSTAFDREFEDTFWPAYRRKTAKKAAKPKFAAARQAATLDAIMAGLGAFDAWKDARGEGADTYPHAATWLHQERWTDVLPVVSRPVATVRCGTAAGRPEPSTVLAYVMDPVTGSIPG